MLQNVVWFLITFRKRFRNVESICFYSWHIYDQKSMIKMFCVCWGGESVDLGEELRTWKLNIEVLFHSYQTLSLLTKWPCMQSSWQISSYHFAISFYTISYLASLFSAGHTYFFSGNSYVKFDDYKVQAEQAGYPRRIAKQWLECSLSLTSSAHDTKATLSQHHLVLLTGTIVLLLFTRRWLLVY